jgi:hypothetical protein
MTGRNVKEYKFIGTLFGISGAHFHRIAHFTDIHEIYAFDGLPVADIKAGDDAFGKHGFIFVSINFATEILSGPQA